MQRLLGRDSRPGRLSSLRTRQRDTCSPHAWLSQNHTRVPVARPHRPPYICVVGQLQQRLPALGAGQVVSRIPGMHAFSQKCGFTRLMRLGQRLFPSLFSFYPPSWNLPEDRASMQKELAGSADALIVKPDDGAQGDGIFIATSLDNLMSHLRSAAPQTPMIVQKYLARPLLLQDLKFDLRVYVFVSSIEPLEVWVCREGLARFCTEKVVV